MAPDEPADLADPAGVRRLRARLREGDDDAFTVLFRTYADRVHRLAARVCSDPAQAEDVTAETFLAAWRHRGTIADTSDPLAAWLLAIATRQALNATRSRRRQRLFVDRHGHRLAAEVPDIAEHVTTRIDDAERLSRTRAALARLHAKELEVLVLCVWEEVSTRDAARALGVAEGTVRSRLSRARSRLRSLSEPAPRPATTLQPDLGARR